MVLQYGNILDKAKDGDIVCFTSNGVIKRDGKLVMGAGNAKFFRDTFKGIDKVYGEQVAKHGNHVLYGGECKYKNKDLLIFSFPTKNNWKDNSNLELIEQSAKELLDVYNRTKEWGFDGKIHLCAPGVTNGKLNWDDVSPILEKYFNDDFIINYLGNL